MLKFTVISAAMALTMRGSMSPITRVAKLMEGLIDKIEADEKAEEKLYKQFVCWCRTIDETKTQSNADAEERIKELTTFIKNIEAGSIEFTTEREDLAKRSALVQEDIAEMVATREAAAKAFAEAERDMELAIDALDEAISVLHEATKDSKKGKGLLLNLRFVLTKASLSQAGGKSNEDLAALAKVIDTHLQPENKDWKKLDAKNADYKKEYSARSSKLQDMFNDMLNTFNDNLAQARKEEGRAKEQYEKLKKAKDDELAKIQGDQSAMKLENAARDKEKGDAETEKGNLEQQVEDDTRFLQETETSCDKKKGEWSERKRLRAEEIAAISNAIGILRSDDARDMFNKSFDSQDGGNFLQISPSKCEQRRSAEALRVLHKSKTVRLRTMAALLEMRKNVTDEFPENILAKIDEVLAELGAEATKDEKEKDDCTELRRVESEKAKDTANAADDNVAEIKKQEGIIAQKEEDIANNKKAIAEIEKQQAEAREQRAKENQEYQQSRSDDQNAINLIEEAKNAMAKFAEDNLQFLQLRQPELEAGEAPPPPPTTWEEGYGGAKGEKEGISALLDMVITDVEKDMAQAKKEEDDSQAAHDKFIKESDQSIADFNKDNDTLTQEKSDAQTTKDSETTDLDGNKSALNAVLQVIEAAEPGCNFATVNFEVRRDNRAAEKDGLEKAKAILKGAEFGFLQC